MADTSSFPTIKKILVEGDNIRNFKVGAAITAGQAVAYHGTGVANTVHPGVTGTTAAAVGIALYSVSTVGDYVAVACDGCKCYCCEGDGNGIDAGEAVSIYGTTTAGTVYTTAVSATDVGVIGVADSDFSANSTGVIVVKTQLVSKAGT